MSNQKNFDVVIIGGGPAGLSAAIWCSDLGLRSVVVELQDSLGGQLLWTFNQITNYPGLLSINGAGLRDIFAGQASELKTQFLLARQIKKIDLAENRVDLDDEVQLSAMFTIIATGVRRRLLGVPGEVEFQGRGVLTSGVKDRLTVGGKTVVVVGGGDASLENAVTLSDVAEKVVVVHRGESFAAREEFVSKAHDLPNVSLRLGTRITAVLGDDIVTGVDLLETGTGKVYAQLADAVLVRIGVTPNTEFIAGQLKLDEKGYIVVGPDCSTELPNVFAIGDVATPASPTIATAVGMGATAAKGIVRVLSGKR